MRRWLPAAAALALGGCAAGQTDRGETDAALLAETLAGRTAGPAQTCIGASTTDGPQVIGDTLIYREGRKLWVSQAADNCPSLRGDPLIIVELYGSQVCRNDRFRTVERGGIGIPGPYCRFGSFVPYTKPAS